MKHTLISGISMLAFGFSQVQAATSPSYQSGNPVYSMMDSGDTNAELLKQVNAQGGKARQFTAQLIFGNESQGSNFYVQYGGDTGSYEYKSVDSMTSMENFLAKLNNLGADGYAYLEDLASGDFFLEIQSYFVRPSGTIRKIEYDLAKADTLKEFTDRLKQMGALGWKWHSFRSFESEGFEPFALFSRCGGQAEQFDYEILKSPTDASGFEEQLNTMGRDQYHWEGSVFLSGTEYNVYVKSSGMAGKYSYMLKSGASSRKAFLEQTNELGANGYFYISETFFSGFSIFSIYASFEPITDTPTPRQPEISIEYPKGKELQNGSALLKLGQVAVGNTIKRKRVVTVRNLGTSRLTGLAISLRGKHAKDFPLRNLKKKSLAPGASTTFKVGFKPRSAGKRKALLVIKSNDADENPYRIRLSAKAFKSAN